MRALDKKLVYDLRRIWAQALAIALVMACGVATIILSIGSYRSLEETRSAFYERYRFGSVFASAVRAPLTLKERIASLPGVSAVELRIMQPVLLDVPLMVEPATGIVVSIPDHREALVNKVYIRQGRLPESGRPDEVAVLETFADAHRFTPGDSFEAIINGKKRKLTIVGTVLSPEFVYAIGPGDMVPDQKRFGVFYMSASVLRGLYDMEGAFDDLSLTTLRNADLKRIMEGLDNILKPYGGSGARSREDQLSHAFLDNELKELRAMAMIIPPIFLFVSAFLVNMILSRLIELEREQVGLLKAIGYTDVAVGWHYTKLVLAIGLVGMVIGVIAGQWLGLGLTRLYGRFFTFPFLIFRHSLDLFLLATGVTMLAAIAGAARAVYSTVRLPPAVAMQPPAPTQYRSLFDRSKRRFQRISRRTIMSTRHLLRWPLRTFLTTLGTSLSVTLLVTAVFAFDSIDYMIDNIFFRTERQDASISLVEALPLDAQYSLRGLPGVKRVEPFRATLTKFRHGETEKRVPIVGISNDSRLLQILDVEQNPVKPPITGLMVPEMLAKQLKLRPGDQVKVELLEHNNRVVSVPVVGLVSSYVGLTSYMSLKSLNRLLREGDRMNGARIRIDANSLPDLYQEIKQTPVITSIALLDVSLQKFRETIRENITTMTTLYVVLAVIITFGVIYNSARIQLSERARELASLRVFGFTRGEVSSVLLAELGIITLLAQPLGWLLGYLFAWMVVKGFESDLYRIPFVVNSETFANASLVVIVAAVVSALIVRRRIDRFDLVRVLKTRE
ncbi:MAG: FtsX-like permease family protein [Arenicellales bacterium]